MEFCFKCQIGFAPFKCHDSILLPVHQHHVLMLIVSDGCDLTHFIVSKIACVHQLIFLCVISVITDFLTLHFYNLLQIAQNSIE